MPITLYLFVFYISTFYSAFFKDDTIQNGDIASALFDPKVLSETKSTMELIGLIAVPFAFLGLGYILHMLNRETKKSWSKVVGLYVVAFVFDFILAYRIEEHAYNSTKTLTSPPFNIPIALASLDFWMIIFAGFVTYVIWGIVFDFIGAQNSSQIRVDDHARMPEDFYNLLLEKGIAGQEIMTLAGHTTYKSFARYVKVTDERKRDAMVKAFGKPQNLNVAK